MKTLLLACFCIAVSSLQRINPSTKYYIDVAVKNSAGEAWTEVYASNGVDVHHSIKSEKHWYIASNHTGYKFEDGKCTGGELARTTAINRRDEIVEANLFLIWSVFGEGPYEECTVGQNKGNIWKAPYLGDAKMCVGESGTVPYSITDFNRYTNVTTVSVISFATAPADLWNIPKPCWDFSDRKSLHLPKVFWANFNRTESDWSGRRPHTFSSIVTSDQNGDRFWGGSWWYLKNISMSLQGGDSYCSTSSDLHAARDVLWAPTYYPVQWIITAEKCNDGHGFIWSNTYAAWKGERLCTNEEATLPYWHSIGIFSSNPVNTTWFDFKTSNVPSIPPLTGMCRH